jgi:hypothetical protein
MNSEQWRDIVGYEKLYQVSSEGNVRGLNRMVSNKDNTNKNIKGIDIKGAYTPSGYKMVSLSKNGEIRSYTIAQLVAQAFIPNPENKPEVDHINGDRTDNRVENLRWCTHKENMNNPITIERLKEARKEFTGKFNPRSKQVLQFTSEGDFVQLWDNAVEVQRKLKIWASMICNCCNGKRQTAGGYKWMYFDIETYLRGLENVS